MCCGMLPGVFDLVLYGIVSCDGVLVFPGLDFRCGLGYLF